MITKEVLLALVAANVNAPGLVKDLLDKVVEPALQKIVEDSAHPFDDMAKQALYPVLKAEVEKLVLEKWTELTTPAPAPQA